MKVRVARTTRSGHPHRDRLLSLWSPDQCSGWESGHQKRCPSPQVLMPGPEELRPHGPQSLARSFPGTTPWIHCGHVFSFPMSSHRQETGHAYAGWNRSAHSNSQNKKATLNVSIKGDISEPSLLFYCWWWCLVVSDSPRTFSE